MNEEKTFMEQEVAEGGYEEKFGEPTQQLVIPINFMCMTGNNDIDQKYWISAGRMAFLTPEQFDIFRMRLNDLIQTLDGFSRNTNDQH